MSAIEYLVRVQPADGAYRASIHQFAPTSHPEVRAMVGPVAYGEGANASAAMVAAIASAHLGVVSAPRESRYAC